MEPTEQDMLNEEYRHELEREQEPKPKVATIRRPPMRSQCLRDAEARTLAETGECVAERKVKPQPWWIEQPHLEEGKWVGAYSHDTAITNPTYEAICPLGHGELRWCKEKYFCWDGGASGMGEDVFFEGDPEIPKFIEDNNLLLFPRELSGGVVGKWRWKRAITMPRWASRATVEILSTDAILRDGVWYWTARERRAE